jgi:hypothetical protein
MKADDASPLLTLLLALDASIVWSQAIDQFPGKLATSPGKWNESILIREIVVPDVKIVLIQ